MAHFAQSPSFILHQVTCQFPTGDTLFGPLNLTLEPSLCALVGRNGSGKTRLLRLLAGLDEPATGHIERFGSHAWVAQQHVISSQTTLAELLGYDAIFTARKRIDSGDYQPDDLALLDGYWDIAERLSEAQLSELENRVNEQGLSLFRFDSQPLWQIAMVLQATQAQRLGLRPDYGIDYQLLTAARAAELPVQELEGADSQIDLLCQLPDGGKALLDDTLTHWHTNARLLQVMIGWWLQQPPSNGTASLPNTFSQSLYDVLMVKRNEAWRDTLLALPPGRYVVAVGALHLYGEGNLPQMLK